VIEKCLLDIKRRAMIKDILPEQEVGDEGFQVSLKVLGVEAFSVWRSM